MSFKIETTDDYVHERILQFKKWPGLLYVRNFYAKKQLPKHADLARINKFFYLNPTNDSIESQLQQISQNDPTPNIIQAEPELTNIRFHSENAGGFGSKSKRVVMTDNK